MSVETLGADLVTTLSDHARRFAAGFAARRDVERVPVPDFLIRARCAGTLAKSVVWRNDVFSGPDFRWAHVEFFSIPDQIGVIHVCVLPRMERHAPVFGFDIIAGRKKATGAFLDLSPTTPAAATITADWAAETAASRAAFAEHRELPDWALGIFSPHALAVRPVCDDEVDRVLALGHMSLGTMLAAPRRPGSASAMKEAQHRYVAGQRRNEHTVRMLANCVGPVLARDFVDNWLFPRPV